MSRKNKKDAADAVDGDEAIDGEGEDQGKKGGKKKLVIGVVVVLLGLFAAKTFLLKDAPKTAAQVAADKKAAALTLYNKCAEANKLPTAAAEALTDKAPKGASTTHPVAIELASTHPVAAAAAPVVDGMGPILSLDSVTVNLIDGHYLKLGVALQLDVTGDATVAKDQGLGAKALDMALSTLERHTMRELIVPATRESIKQNLGLRTCQAYQGAVLTVYFTEFVMQ
jgi:flagellar FliL protein